jgi:TolB-like protein/Flp pilus assembly protein TadD
MQYHFDAYRLDPDTFELKKQGRLVPVEPQVFHLLKLLIENRDRMVSKDQIIETVWGGRAISDTSIANRIKLARAAVGDDGKRQQKIRTVHGRGFRFVAEVEASPPSRETECAMTATGTIENTSGAPSAETGAPDNRPSIAILPFQFLGTPGPKSILAEAIPYDLIQALSRLRWLFVIARGSSFRLHSLNHDPVATGRALGVRYGLIGTVECDGPRLVVTTELSDTQTGGIIWSERFVSAQADAHQIRQDIVAKVVSSLEVYIPLNEAAHARLAVSENLDAWANYHLGLQHMYRFTRSENAKATAHFELAIKQDPEFSRAHAGLSFTHFQTAFLNYDGHQSDALLQSRRSAERSMELDPVDPFANYTMGRSALLQGELENSVAWLDRAITLNPNYSQGYYSHAFASLLSGRTDSSLGNVDTALSLSPLDPLVYAMLAARALSLVIDEDYDSAVKAAEQAARAPGAHFLIDMIAVIAFSLNRDEERARYWADHVRKRRPDACQALFFASFPFSSGAIKRRIAGALALYGF